MTRTPKPGIDRNNRIDDEGLARLEAQLKRGSQIAPAVLAQWVRRYGDAARDMLCQYNCYRDEFDALD